jgi:hypothetical protein
MNTRSEFLCQADIAVHRHARRVADSLDDRSYDASQVVDCQILLADLDKVDASGDRTSCQVGEW